MKNLSRRERNCIIGLLVFFGIALLIGIKSVYAYYADENDSRQMFAAYVGDFYVQQGDLSINVYQKVGSLNGVYKRVSAIPTNKEPSRVACVKGEYTISGTTATAKDGAAITCSNGAGTGSCSYTYSATDGKIKLESSEPVRCKFYFD